jgi:hypothetical protein
MKYKIGDKVIFLKKSYKEDAWPLIDFEKYEISNRAFDKMGIDTYYGVINKDGRSSTWYLEEDFISLNEYRKLKIKKINGKLTY